MEHCPGLEKPELMMATNYRHYIATAIRREELTDAERKSFYNHMGHSERVNQGIYQSPPAFTAVTKRRQVVVVVVVYLTTNQRHMGYLSSGTWQEDTVPLRVQESRRHWVFKVGQSRYPKTNLKPL